MTKIATIRPDLNYLVVEAGLTWLENTSVITGAELLTDLSRNNWTWQEMQEMGIELEETTREPYSPTAEKTKALYFEYVEYMRNYDEPGMFLLPIHWLAKTHKEMEADERVYFAYAMFEFGQSRLAEHSTKH